MRTSFVALAIALPFVATASAQEKKTVARTPGDVEVQFANGSSVRMIVQTEALEVRTPYGTLSVPVKDIKQIDFGVHYSEDVEKQIEENIRKLNAENFRERESATNALIKLGADAYPAVYEAAKNPVDLEAAKRAKAVLQSMTQNLPAKDLRLQHNDLIVTPTFTIAGRILTRTIKAKTDYFGDVQLQVGQLRSMRASDVSTEVNVHVDAGKYGSQNNNEWLATDFALDARTRIVVTASGSVNLRPNIPGAALECNANGYSPAAAAGFAKAAAANRRLPGALIGKVGENGAPFVIGENFDGAPGRDGKLYLQIVPSPYNQESAGGYQVKIVSRH